MSISAITCKNDLLRHFICTESPLFFDIGANKGQSSKNFRSLFSNSKLYLFEPDPLLSEKLQKEFSDCNSKVQNFAISNNQNERNFKCYSNSEANSFYDLDKKGYYFSRDYVKQREFTVQCKTIDNIVSEESIENIDFLKIDTQGHSFEVLEGAKETLFHKKVQYLQVEVNISGFYEKNESLSKILTFLENLDYELYTFIHGDSEQIGHFFFDFNNGSICSLDLFIKRKD